MNKEEIKQDENKTQVEFVNNENGKYIIGCDPVFIPNLWQKFWMMFGFYKKYKSHSSILRINADGSLYHVRLSQDDQEELQKCKDSPVYFYNKYFRKEGQKELTKTEFNGYLNDFFWND